MAGQHLKRSKSFTYLGMLFHEDFIYLLPSFPEYRLVEWISETEALSATSKSEATGPWARPEAAFKFGATSQGPTERAFQENTISWRPRLKHLKRTT